MGRIFLPLLVFTFLLTVLVLIKLGLWLWGRWSILFFLIAFCFTLFRHFMKNLNKLTRLVARKILTDTDLLGQETCEPCQLLSEHFFVLSRSHSTDFEQPRA